MAAVVAAVAAIAMSMTTAAAKAAEAAATPLPSVCLKSSSKDACEKNKDCVWGGGVYKGCGPKEAAGLRASTAELFCSELRYEADVLRLWNWFLHPITTGADDKLWQPAVALAGRVPPAVKKAATPATGLLANTLRGGKAPVKLTTDVLQHEVFPNLRPLMAQQAALLVATTAAVLPKEVTGDAATAALPLKVAAPVKEWTTVKGGCMEAVATAGVTQLPGLADVSAAVLAVATATVKMMEDARWQSRMAGYMRLYATWDRIPAPLEPWVKVGEAATAASGAAGYGNANYESLLAGVMQRGARYPLLLRASLAAMQKAAASPQDISAMGELVARATAAMGAVNDALAPPSNSVPTGAAPPTTRSSGSKPVGSSSSSGSNGGSQSSGGNSNGGSPSGSSSGGTPDSSKPSGGSSSDDGSKPVGSAGSDTAGSSDGNGGKPAGGSNDGSKPAGGSNDGGKPSGGSNDSGSQPGGGSDGNEVPSVASGAAAATKKK